MAVIDYGDVLLDYGNHQKTPALIEEKAAEIIASGAYLLGLGGDHFVTWPLLKAHAAKHGPLALVHFDAHQDTWDDDGQRIDHGSFVCRAVREGVIDPTKSIQIGIRTEAPEDFGIKIIPGYEVEDMGTGDCRCDPCACRERSHLSDIRHRLPGPGLCARHRDAGRRRAVVCQDPLGPAQARGPRHPRL